MTEVDEGGEGRGGEGRARMDWKCASSTVYKHGPFAHLEVIVYIHPYVPFLPVHFCILTVWQSCRRQRNKHLDPVTVVLCHHFYLLTLKPQHLFSRKRIASDGGNLVDFSKTIPVYISSKPAATISPPTAMYSSSYSRAKFGQEAREPLHHRKGKSCGYYMRIIFFFSSLIQSLIIVSLVLFLIYGQPEKSAEEKRVEVSDFSLCINLIFIDQMLRTTYFKS